MGELAVRRPTDRRCPVAAAWRIRSAACVPCRMRRPSSTSSSAKVPVAGDQGRKYRRWQLAHAAQRMRDLDIGAMPVCGDDDRLHGMITDRDIVIKCVAAGGDPTTMTAGALAQGTPVFIGADEDAGQVLHLMEDHRIRRLPMIDNHRLVGMISEADLFRHLSEQAVGHFVEEVCASG
ncbi:CBS domain-containing protein [Actinoallomurus sp. CA-142502]|uniref:CBS domain-containing protein n=1 Tax=Actinoallomurus sp. CA-142502 TaxID=3239885 RepID=UPI003D8EBC4F